MSPLQVKDGALHSCFLLTCLASSASFCSLCVCRRLPLRLQPRVFFPGSGGALAETLGL